MPLSNPGPASVGIVSTTTADCSSRPAVHAFESLRSITSSPTAREKRRESSLVYWRFAWRLPLRNTSDSPARFTAVIKFLEADGFDVAEDSAYGLSLGPGEEREFTGATLINLPAAATVTKTRVEFQHRPDAGREAVEFPPLAAGEAP